MLIINWEMVGKILMVEIFLGKHWVIIGLTLGLGEYWLLIEKSMIVINVLSIFDHNTTSQRAPRSIRAGARAHTRRGGDQDQYLKGDGMSRSHL